MWTRLLALVLIFVLPLAACGDPDVGDACEYHSCAEDGVSAFICESGFYEKVACPGGCEASQVPGVLWTTCRLEGIIPGDACATAWHGLVQCESDARAMVCRSGVWTRKQCQERCVSGDGLPDGSNGVCE